MDKGAHFFKCDFQTHTPRDLRWNGSDAITEDERKAYAEELISACRKKGLNAIAITDHHDFAFFPYIKKASEDEVGETGEPVPTNERIIVFPGLELTLTAPNCQALLILDANFPENLLQSILTALSIIAAPNSDSKHAQILRIPQNVVSDLADLYEKLNTHAYIKGRFIVLPNVSEGGNTTILRSGFSNFYKAMPCVGGYIDGSISQFGSGNLSIVNGKNKEYGFKAIGIFQTSDNRRRDHSDLGKHTSWVKWSEPTAEALRQACLAKESRMSQSEPQLPNISITSVTVSNSKFLSRVDLEFNPQYNAIIGGRGTGKSTILEYLRYGLCDQPVENYETDVAPVHAKRKKLIEDTLQRFDGEVHVSFLLNGIDHIVKRNSTTQEIQLKIGDGNFQRSTEQEIRNLMPIQAYSQKQLSSVGIRVEELKRFIELPIKKTLDEIRFEIGDVSNKIRNSFGKLIRQQEIETEINKHNTEIESLTQQLMLLRSSLKGLSEEEQEIIKQKGKYEFEEEIIKGNRNELERQKLLVETLRIELDNGGIQKEDQQLQNPAIITEIEGLFAAKFSEIKEQINVLSGLFNEASSQQINEKELQWVSLFNAFNIKYEAAKANANVNQQLLTEIQDIEGRIARLRKLLQESKNALLALGNPITEYNALREQWNSLHTRKIKLLDEQCNKLTELSNGYITAEVAKSLDFNLLKQSFKIALSSMNIRENKIDDLCNYILSSQEPLFAWNNVVVELEHLLKHVAGSPELLPATTIMDECNFIVSEKLRIASNLTVHKWLDLSLAVLEFTPIFKYRTNAQTSEYIAFEDASAGQQATALLTVLLNQVGAPLIIDQPEDDIDSRLIVSITEQLWQAKSKRQLIFASHNANFVVNGDAELIICCDYIKAGDQTGGHIKLQGAIDNVLMRDEITNVTEGGKEAFSLRMKKYGF